VEQGLSIAKEIGESWNVTQLYDALALTAAFEGDLLRAEEHAHHAVALARRQESRYLEALCSATLGAIGARLGRSSAAGILREAAAALEGMDARREAARALLWIAQAQFRAGDAAGARRHLSKGLQLASELGSDGVLDLHARWDATMFVQLSADGEERARLQAALERVQGPADPSPAAPVATLPSLAARAFGPGVLLLDGSREVVWAWDKTRELFFFLLHNGPRRREQIVDALWPDSPPERARAALHTSVYRLRRAVHRHAIVLHDGVYRINEELITSYDARELERLLRLARAERGEEAASLLRQAAGLYSAPFLEDLHAEWCSAERDRLERAHLTCLEALIDAEAATGRWRESIAAGERLLALDPLREDVHARIVRAYLRLGDHASARRHMERCTATLWQELAVTPGPELQALQRRIRA
jgi:DNA-binding SARP family transcriptional activator